MFAAAAVVGAFKAFGAALLFKSTVVAGIAAWSAVAGVGMGLYSMHAAMQMAKNLPKTESTGTQLQMKLSSTEPVPIVFGRTAVGGTLVYRDVHEPKNARLAMTSILSTGPIEAWEKTYFNDIEMSWNGDPNTADGGVFANAPSGSKLYGDGYAIMYVQKGLRPELYDWATKIGQAGKEPGVTSSTLLSGLAYTHFNFLYDQEKFPQGVPRMVHVIKGEKHYDPRKDSTYPGGSGSHRLADLSTYEFSENPYIIALNWVLGRKGGQSGTKKLWGIGAPWDSVDVAAFVTGANVADANNWKCGGQVTSDEGKFSVLNTILQAGGGVPISRGAQISCYVNTPKTAVYTITPDDLAQGNIEIISSTPWKDRKNHVVPRYRQENKMWQIAPGEVVSDAGVYTAEDGGEVKTIEIEYPMCQSATQAHQLGALDMVNSREFLQLTISCKPKTLGIQVGDTVVADLDDVALPNKKFLVTAKSYDPESGIVQFTMRHENDAKYDFVLGRTHVPPPSGGLSGEYDPSNPGPPKNAGDWFLIGSSISANGVVQPALVVRGAMDAEDKVNNQSIIAEYKLANSTTWTSWTEAPKTATAFDITAVTPNTSYHAGISYRNLHGVVGERIVLGPITTADVRIPISKTDLPMTNEQIIANAVAWWNGTNYVTVQDTLGNLAQTNATVEAAILHADTKFQESRNYTNAVVSAANATLTNSVTSLWSAIDYNFPVSNTIGSYVHTIANTTNTAAQRVTTLETIVGNTATTPGSLRARIGTLENTTVTANTALSNRMSFLESYVGNSSNTVGGTITARLGSLETTFASNSAAMANTVTSLQAGIYNASNSSSIVSRIGTVSNVAVQANSTATAAAQRVDGLETAIYNQANTNSILSRIITAQNTATTANATANTTATSLQNLTSAIYSTSNSTSIQSQITTLNTTTASIGAWGDALNKNPTFSTWSGGSGTLPSNWSDWVNAQSNSTKVTGQNSNNAIRFATPASQTGHGMAQDWNNGLPPIHTGQYILEAHVTLESGTLSGAGLTIGNFNDAGSANPSSATLHFATDRDISNSVVGAGTVGQTYRFSKVVNLTQGGTLGRARLWLMNTWSGFGGSHTTARTITWHKASIRPASSAESNAVTTATQINLIQSDISSATGGTSLTAKIGTISGTIADAINGKASASRVDTLESGIYNTANTSSVMARITNVSNTAVNANGTATAAQTLAVQASNRANTAQSQVSQVMTATAGLNASSTYALTVQSGSYITGIQATAGGGGTAFRILSDNFALVDPGNTGTARVAFAYNSGQLYLGSQVLVNGDLLVNGTVRAIHVVARGITSTYATGAPVGSGIPGGETKILNAGFSAEQSGSDTLVFFSITATSFSGTSGIAANLYCNGAHVAHRAFMISQSFQHTGTWMAKYNPPSGFNSWDIYCYGTSGSSMSGRIDECYISVSEMKR